MDAKGIKHEAQLRGWQEKVMECRGSGMSVNAWCKEQGIKRATYYRWEKELLARAGEQMAIGAQKDSPTFVEVREPVEEERCAKAGTGTVAARLHTVAGELDIYAGADVETLRAVMEALKGAE